MLLFRLREVFLLLVPMDMSYLGMPLLQGRAARAIMMLDSILKNLFIFGIAYVLIGSFIERFILYGTINKFRDNKKFHAWSKNETLNNLEEYKNIIKSKGKSMFFYWYIFVLYKYGILYIVLVLFFMLLTIFNL